MSSEDPFFKVRLTTVLDIKPHPKPEVHSLEIVKIYDWEVVGRKGTYHVGDKVFYVPVNSLLPQWLEDHLFPPDSKIKLDKHRIKAIKIQGFVSQGMLIPARDAVEAISDKKSDQDFLLAKLELEKDFKEELQITKYEPPTKEIKQNAPGKPGAKKKDENPNFKKYNGLDNLKYYPSIFKDGERVFISEKIHGTNFRAGWVPFVPGTFWDKIKKFFGKKWEFVYGSNNVQLQDKPKNHKGYYDENHYLAMVNKFNLKEKLAKGEVVYGEIYGDGIQKNYNYGCAQGERKIVLFDLMNVDEDEFTWRPSDELKDLCEQEGLPLVPVLYEGPWNKELAEKLVFGPSTLDASQKVREGIVVKNVDDYTENRKAFKWVSPDYAMKEAAGETSDDK